MDKTKSLVRLLKQDFNSDIDWLSVIDLIKRDLRLENVGTKGHVDWSDEITTLRQQVAELEDKLEAVSTESYLTNDDLHKEQALSSTLQNQCDRQKHQLALRELEILKLREALESICRVNGTTPVLTYQAMESIAKQALSTPFTPEHLNEWLKERASDGICCADGCIKCDARKQVKEIV